MNITVRQLNAYLANKEPYPGGKDYFRPVELIVCTDGAKLSVQASQFHYSTPRENQGPWTHVEIGFPDPTPIWWESVTDENIAAYVPINWIVDHINDHGGAQL